MEKFDHPLARRTVIKGAGLGLVAGGFAGALSTPGASAAGSEGGEIWSSEYWARKAIFPCGCIASGWDAESRRAFAAGAVLCSRSS